MKNRVFDGGSLLFVNGPLERFEPVAYSVLPVAYSVLPVAYSVLPVAR